MLAVLAVLAVEAVEDAGLTTVGITAADSFSTLSSDHSLRDGQPALRPSPSLQITPATRTAQSENYTRVSDARPNFTSSVHFKTYQFFSVTSVMQINVHSDVKYKYDPEGSVQPQFLPRKAAQPVVIWIFENFDDDHFKNVSYVSLGPRR